MTADLATSVAERRYRLALGALAALAAALRVAAAVPAARRFAPIMDEWAYLALARQLLAGHGLTAPPGQGLGFVVVDGQPTSLWGVGQPLYLAMVQRLFGPSPLAPFLGNAVLGAVVVLLTAALARRHFGRAAALVAGLAMAVDPDAVRHSATLLSEPLYLVALTAALALAGGRPGTGRALACGLALGGAALVRATAFHFLPLLLVGLVARSGRRALRPGLLVAAATVAAVSPWLVRNLAVHDHLVLLDTKAGYNLWLANLEGSLSDVVQALPAGFWQLSESGRSRWLGRQALGRIRRDPLGFVRRGLGHVLDLWSPFPSGRTRGWGRLLRPLFLVPLELLALAGIACSWPRRRELWVPLLLLLYYSAVHFVMVGGPRFRLPLDPVLACFAGLAASRIRAVATRLASLRLQGGPPARIG